MISVCELWNCALSNDKQIFQSTVSFNAHFVLIDMISLNSPTLMLFLLLKLKSRMAFTIRNQKYITKKNIPCLFMLHCIDVVTLE